MRTDASKLYFGAILTQQFEGKSYPVYYYIKKASESESKLLSYSLEIKDAFFGNEKTTKLSSRKKVRLSYRLFGLQTNILQFPDT